MGEQAQRASLSMIARLPWVAFGAWAVFVGLMLGIVGTFAAIDAETYPGHGPPPPGCCVAPLWIKALLALAVGLLISGGVAIVFGFGRWVRSRVRGRE